MHRDPEPALPAVSATWPVEAGVPSLRVQIEPPPSHEHHVAVWLCQKPVLRRVKEILWLVSRFLSLPPSLPPSFSPFHVTTTFLCSGANWASFWTGWSVTGVQIRVCVDQCLYLLWRPTGGLLYFFKASAIINVISLPRGPRKSASKHKLKYLYVPIYGSQGHVPFLWDFNETGQVCIFLKHAFTMVLTVHPGVIQ